ncbi:acidic mammalian chitinase [Caretta caretta]|uniref:acidic mammalian chitinase n=1 Tax=Caretta caretta TaxID=8467 RepID=UPI003F4B15E8
MRLNVLEELAKAFQEKAQKTGKQKLILSATVGAVRALIEASYEIDKISEAVDFLNLLTFDFHGSWQKVTGHVSPFLQGKENSKSSSYCNVDYAVRYWRSKGAPTEKLIMGIPTYGRSFTLSSKTGISVPVSGPGLPIPFTQKAGLLAYSEICTFTPGATTERIVEQEVPYSYEGNQWAGYDDEQSIITKAKWLLENNFGGAMVWAIDLDDFTGTFCGEGKYPLMNSLKSVLGVTTPRKANGLYPDPSNNHAFYHCVSRKTYLQFCQASLIFDSSCSFCNWA